MNIYKKLIGSEQVNLNQGLNLQLIGYLDSPFVRHVAITMQFFGIAVAWRFMQHIERVNLEPEDYPALVAFSARAELLPEFMACPVSD